MTPPAPAARPAWGPVLAVVVTLGLALAFLLAGQRGSPGLPQSLSMGSLTLVLDELAHGPVALSSYPEVAVVAVRPSAEYRSAVRWGVEDGTALVSPDLVLIALDLRDPAGGTVRWCATSGRFENAATGGAYSFGGAWRGGPSPRGLDRFGLDVRGEEVVVDTTTWVSGLARDRVDGAEPPAGPPCG